MAVNAERVLGEDSLEWKGGGGERWDRRSTGLTPRGVDQRDEVIGGWSIPAIWDKE